MLAEEWQSLSEEPGQAQIYGAPLYQGELAKKKKVRWERETATAKERVHRDTVGSRETSSMLHARRCREASSSSHPGSALLCSAFSDLFLQHGLRGGVVRELLTGPTDIGNLQLASSDGRRGVCVH